MTSVAVKAPVACATTGPITLSGTQTIDGVAVAVTIPPTRVMVKDQADPKTNGIYDVLAGAWLRSVDFDGAYDAVTGTLVFVVGGATNRQSFWQVASANPIVFGTSPITFNPQTAVSSLQFITPELYGAIGDGVTDDTTAVQAFFDAVSHHIGLMAGNYLVTSLLNATLTDCRIFGVPGRAKIAGSFGYAILAFGPLDHVIIEDVEFTTNYVNAVEDPTYSCVYSMQQNVLETVFRRCKFTSPQANTSGLTFYTRVNPADTAVIDGLWIEDCVFLNVGRIGSTIMNRGTNADKYDAARRVYFNRNKGINLGLSGTFGQLVSFDGFGSAFTCNDNYIYNGLTIGVENTGWINGEIRNNVGENFSRVWSLLSVDGSNPSPRIITGMTIVGNRTIGSASAHSNFIYVHDSYFAGNIFDVTAASDEDEAALFRACQNNNIFGDKYINRSAGARHALYCEHDTSTNEWDHCTFDMSSVTSSNFAIFFSDAGSVGTMTTGNRIHAPRIGVATGGQACGQDTGVVGNVCDPFIKLIDAAPLNFSIATFPADADFTVGSPMDVIAYDIMQINGTLTATRVLNFPSGACFSHPRTVKNNTAQSVTLAAAGVPGDTIAAGAVALYFFDGTTLKQP